LLLQAKRLNGNDVWVLQHCLVEEGYTDVGEVDGWFGPATRKAVIQFQDRMRLDATGTVDAKTWKSLVGPDEEPLNYMGD
jgi:peptidoglycan hydrolase-like protein with peptidoglycan-binding domain